MVVICDVEDMLSDSGAEGEGDDEGDAAERREPCEPAVLSARVLRELEASEAR